MQIAFEQNIIDIATSIFKINSYTSDNKNNLPNPYLKGFTPPPNFNAS
jgi:hypothetical protein